MQTLVYSMNKLGQIVINVLILVGFSGPMMNCPGYQPDPNIPCTNNQAVLNRVDPDLLSSNQYGWCHEICSGATFDFDITIPEFALSICFVIVASIPLYLRLKEDKVEATAKVEFINNFWSQLQRRAAWQVILYGMISHITFGVMNAAKMPANYVWLGLHTFQHQIMVIFEKLVFFIGLNLVRKYALNISWRKLVLVGSFFVLCFNSLYFFIIFDIWRDSECPWLVLLVLCFAFVAISRALFVFHSLVLYIHRRCECSRLGLFILCFTFVPISMFLIVSLRVPCSCTHLISWQGEFQRCGPISLTTTVCCSI
jgi:hypothetical protein